MAHDPIYSPAKYVDKKYAELAAKFPHLHQPFFKRPDLSRRRFFRYASSGVAGSYLAGRLAAQQSPVDTNQGMATKNTAKNCIFILLTGAISAWDSFDLKMTSGANGSTPATFQPTTINGTAWPAGLLPKLGQQLNNMALVRSMSSHALVHTLAQTWSQIGRNPAAALGNIAPNIGSVVAIEKNSQRQPGQIFPPFVALDSPSGVGQGYFPATYAPFRVSEPSGTANAGIPDVTNKNGQTLFNTMFARMHQLDDPLRINSPYGQPLDDFNDFYTQANSMMYNPVVDQAFGFTAADSTRYGSSAFGNSCLVAKQILASNQGTRFIQRLASEAGISTWTSTGSIIPRATTCSPWARNWITASPR